MNTTHPFHDLCMIMFHVHYPPANTRFMYTTRPLTHVRFMNTIHQISHNSKRFLSSAHTASGMNMVFSAGILVLAQYFDKRHCLATTLAMIGNGVGIFVMVSNC